MLPQRQRDGRGRTALLVGSSALACVALVLLAHPSLLPWSAVKGAAANAAAAAADLDPQYTGEELHRDLDMVQQQRFIESIYQETEALQEDELAKLPPNTFENSIVMPHPDNPASNLKYLWDFFPPSYNCPLREKVGIQHGIGDNGKWVCGVRTLLKRSPCIVYSFGSNGETSFEQDILRATKCEVHVFDPTLGEEERKRVAAIHGLTLHEFGLGVKDGQVAVTSPRMVMGRSVTSFPVKTLATIMHELHHEWVDVLKMDVEGAEWAVLDALVRGKEPLAFTQLQVEYHYYPDNEISRPPAMLAVLQGLKRRGLRTFSVEPNIWWLNNGHDFMEFAYVQVSRDGNIVTSRRSGRRTAAAGALGRLARAGVGSHSSSSGPHAHHGLPPHMTPS